jgi:AraC-like DNA-binding protein
VSARLTAALAEQHELIECRDLEQFWDVVMSSPLDGCVVDIYHPSTPLSLTDLQRLRRRVPPLAIIVYADFEDRQLDLFELGRLKIDGVILAGATDQESAQSAVAGALAAAAALGVLAALEGQLHPLGMECLRWSIEHADNGPTVALLSEALGLSPAVLTRELRQRQLPPPARLLLWGRLFRAARMLSGQDLSVEDVAFRLGYSTASALGRAVQREVGVPPTKLRGGGAIARVLDGFVRREVRTGGRARA